MRPSNFTLRIKVHSQLKNMFIHHLSLPDTVKNDASIRFCLDNKDDVTEHHQSKLTDPVEPETINVLQSFRSTRYL